MDKHEGGRDLVKVCVEEGEEEDEGEIYFVQIYVRVRVRDGVRVHPRCINRIRE